MRFLAYLDANSGSMITAAVAGGLAGIAVVFKLWWRRVTGVFMPKRRAAARARARPTETPAGARGDATASEADATSPAAQAPVEK